MEPGPWTPYTYNGLSASGSATGSFSAAGQRAVADFQQAMGTQPGASQLLQLAGMTPAAVAAAANSTFLSSNYEPVFSSLFHQKSQYGALTHHRQALVKPGDSELTAALRDNYMHQSVATSTAAALYEQSSQLNWSQASTSLGSPFGVLPHESVSGGSSKSPVSDKKGHVYTEGATPPYENTFSAHLSPPFAHGYTNAQLSDFRNSSNSYDSKKTQKLIESKPVAPWQGAFSQVTSSRECASLPPPPTASFAQKAAANFSSRAAAAAVAASSAAAAHQQLTSQSCIRQSHHQVPPNLPFVPQHRPSSVPALEKVAPRFSPKNTPTKAQTKSFSSAPIDASIAESSQSPRYGLDANHNFSSSSTVTPPVTKSIPQAHQRAPYPNPTLAHMAQYRNYPSPDTAPSHEYQRSTPDSIALSPYSDSEPQHCHAQNGGSSSSSGIGRPSPTQNSPLSQHAPSPAYYNSPMSAPSPLHESCAYSKPPTQPQSYPSVIQCNDIKQRQNFAMKQAWEMQEKLVRCVRDGVPRFPYTTESMDVIDESGMLGNGEQRHYEPSNVNMQELATASNEDLLASRNADPDTDEYDRRRGRKVKRRKSDDKVKQSMQQQQQHHHQQQLQQQTCSYPNGSGVGYFPSNYHEMAARNAMGGYHPRLGFTQCATPNSVYQMGPLQLSMQQQSSSNSNVPPQTPEKPPGPSVDDELGFLEDAKSTAPPCTAVSTTNNPSIKPSVSKDSNNGFMDSYLKFLRGETETPLTVTVRAGRKSPKVADLPRKFATVSRSVAAAKESAPPVVLPMEKPYNPPQQQITVPPVQQQKKIHTIEENAPVEMPSCRLVEDNSKVKETPATPQVPRAEIALEDVCLSQRARGRPPKRSAPQSQEENIPEDLPARKTTRRKAKDIAKRRKLVDLSEDEEPVDPDSDTDPAWTPPLDEESKVGRKKYFFKRRSMSRSLSVSTPESVPHKRRGRPIRDDSPVMEGRIVKGRVVQSVGSDSSGDGDNLRRIKTVGPKLPKYRQNEYDPPDELDALFVSGAFVIPKAESYDDCPNIWRIDGKNLIQKFEPFEEDGKTYYRNVSTYSGWTPESYSRYDIAKVIFIKSTKSDTVVHLNRKDLKKRLEALKRKTVVELEDYLDPFRTYMQTLVSQVLDSNFISVILVENDDYFVTSMKKVDNLVENKRDRFRQVLELKEETEDLVLKWPDLTLKTLKDNNIECAACGNTSADILMTFSGECYDHVTLNITAVASRNSNDREVPVCGKCKKYVSMYQRLVHLKFNYYKLCTSKVKDVKTKNPSIETSDLLQSILAAEWIEMLFQQLQEFWAQIELAVISTCSISKKNGTK